ncbi:hypothetical protein ACFL0W_03640 [Nanoarchaeota archaeon]
MRGKHKGSSRMKKPAKRGEKRTHRTRPNAQKASKTKTSKKKISRDSKRTKKPLERKKPSGKIVKIEEGIKKELKKEVEELEHVTRMSDIPKGLRVLIYYLFVMFFIYGLYFIYSFVNPNIMFLGKLVSGFGAVFINMLTVFFIAVAIWGLVKRKTYGWYLGVAFFIFSSINSFLLLLIGEFSTFSIVQELISVSSVILIVINLLVLWYLFYRKAYFFTKKHMTFHTSKDKFFVYTLVCFWFVAILIVSAISVSSYKETTALVDEVWFNIYGTEIEESVTYCKSLEVEKQDLCLIVAAMGRNTNDVLEIHKVCKHVNSDFYKYTCYKSSRKE